MMLEFTQLLILAHEMKIERSILETGDLKNCIIEVMIYMYKINNE